MEKHTSYAILKFWQYQVQTEIQFAFAGARIWATFQKLQSVKATLFEHQIPRNLASDDQIR